ncbi:hypothetical protein FA13DRAFT_1802068 [Coprinellus micaceus]|uniref:CxC2-like cysteine cluster KDZ transposase-associated domain-containing protein n=1 Tax=Coprinellus micaceus TaxID=71717 RepID=A0A4Y7SCW3_COPMI|nr:hypothetical protein FA13DRAFT_1802068 [Coprinellus micaceus]
MSTSKRPRKLDASDNPIPPSSSTKRSKNTPGPRSAFRPIGRSVSSGSRTTTLKDRNRRGTTLVDQSTAAGPSTIPTNTTALTESGADSCAPHDLTDLNNALPPSQPSESGPTKNVEKKPKRVRDYTNKKKVEDWLPLRQTYLNEMLRLDGFGDYVHQTSEAKLMGSCSQCGTVPKGCELYRCTSGCFDGCMLKCRMCTVLKHSSLPLHKIEVWNGKHFVKSSLCDLGLRFQLGHGGCGCSQPIAGPRNFLAFDTSGVHRLAIDYCGCPVNIGVEKHIQLIRAAWFPATTRRPQTVFTFDMLETLHELTLQSKTNVYDFYNTIIQKSDKLRLGKIPSRTNDLHQCFRIYRCLLLLKRGGRGNDANGVEGTALGELAVICPACPQPGRNLPMGWEAAAKALAFLYTLFLAIDANFKLKGKARGISDVELMPGWVYCLEEIGYQAHLNNPKYRDESEINTCQSEHDAVVRAAVRRTPGYNVTGAGVVICSRHGLIRPNGIGDLQRGERYCNMDYIFLATIALASVLRIVITYDIACQWSKKLKARMEDYPEQLRPSPKVDIVAAIPSWHINGHGVDCQTNFALGFREMAPAARHEALNDMGSGYNIKKIVRFGPSFAKKVVLAHGMKTKHCSNFDQMTASFERDGIDLRSWERQIKEWEGERAKGVSQKYLRIVKRISMQEVRHQLAQEDLAITSNAAERAGVPDRENEHNVATGTSGNTAIVTSLPTFISVGLTLEEQMRNLAHERSQQKESKSTKEKTDLLEKSTALFRRIQTWRKTQLLLQPVVSTLTPGDSDSDDMQAQAKSPESCELHLPSSLTVTDRQAFPKLADIERRLRLAQADDALEEIRRCRRIIQGTYQFKQLNLAGQGNKPNTRLRTMWNQLQSRIQRAVRRYQAARNALVALDPEGTWQNRYQILRPDMDVKGPGKEDWESNGMYIASWIWGVPRMFGGSVDSQAEVSECHRIEWSKARARTQRWEEEYLLVKEEMRRTSHYMEWKAEWWRSRADASVQGVSEEVRHGAKAYAYKQATLCQQLAKKFRDSWTAILAKIGDQITWGGVGTSIETQNAGVPREESADSESANKQHDDGGTEEDGTEGEESDDDGDDDEEVDEEDIAFEVDEYDFENDFDMDE